MNLDVETLGKYPFLKEAKQYVDSLALTLEEMKEHPVYSAAFELGKERARNAVNNSIAQEIEDKISAEFSILSYAIARILINLTHHKILLQKYSRGEAEQAYEFLKDEDEEVVEKIMQEVNFNLEHGKLPLPHYLQFSKNLVRENPQSWKLIHRELNNGMVKIREEERLILLREAITEKIAQPIPTQRAPEEFSQLARNLKNTLLRSKRKIKVREINKKALPPCISSLLRSLEAGDTSHQGMFILATFFINLGLPKQKIIQIFSKFPDFREDKTRYQIEFLSGEKSETKYTCPSCEKIKFYGLCPEDCGVNHPLSYYFKKRRKR